MSTGSGHVRDEVKLDFAREARLGFGETVFCAQKTVPQIEEILRQSTAARRPLLLTRLDRHKHAALAPDLSAAMDYDPVSRTSFSGWTPAPGRTGLVAVVAAGTSDAPVAREATRTLAFHGLAATAVLDVGVAGLWRLLEREAEIAAHPVVIAVAGMDAALPSVIGGLVPGAVVAVPTSTGYGVARDGETALFAMLASCAPGLTVCNIDNGYGAAIAALRVLNAAARLVR